jgi:aryl-alcohol dehydrogenase-like predicted oxidoreductase
MEYRNLGSTSLKVSLVSYGNWLNCNDPETILKNKEIIKHAWDLGINYFDTAEGYGKG